MKRLLVMLAMGTVMSSSTATAVAGKRIGNSPRDGTGFAGEVPDLRSCRSPLVAGGESGARWIKASVRMDAVNALALLAEVGGFNLATVLPILATSLGYASGALPHHLDVTIEVRATRGFEP